MEKLKILIVEDEALIALDLKEQLQESGYSVVGTYNNGSDALKVFEAFKVDLVLLDINIKGDIDGIELAIAIRACSNIPIIFLTAMSGRAFIERAKQVLPSAYLLKPYQEASLLIAIEMALVNCSAQRTAAAPFSLRDSKNTRSDDLNLLAEDSKEVFLVQHGFAIIKPQKTFIKIDIRSILYLEADQIYTKIHTDAQTYLVRTALQSIFDKLSDSDFIRTHRSFIINKAFVSSFDMDSVCICAQVLPISKANKANVLRLLS